ncbi:MAG TPA: hypothetical protein VN951_13115 [Pyrinomonadaceae bacterium]|nr:hypothetical protein [Pyrinomonadaceae bacterium]
MAQAIYGTTLTEATETDTTAPGYQGYQILHLGFTVAPIVAGLDKFFHLLVNWDQYRHSSTI